MVFTPLAAASGASPLLRPILMSYREMRYERVVRQTEWYTCGPAALATLLSYYYEVPATEQEMLALAVGAMRGTNRDPTRGITLLALKEALEEKGIPSQGYRVTLQALADYFRRGGPPVILHVTRPQLHYVVAVGILESEVVLADPSRGMYMISFDGLVTEKGFQGIVLMPMPSAPLLRRALDNQAQTLLVQRARLRRLNMLRDTLSS